MGLRPDFLLTIGSADVTARVRDRLLRLSLVDASGEDGDTFEFEIDDRDGLVAAPRRGVSISVSLGYADQALTTMGEFTVDEVELAGPPELMTVRAKSADMRSTIKSPRTRAWSNTTIARIVQTIASEHGLKPAVAASLGATVVQHRDQTNESDLHFLTRLAVDHGAVAAAKHGRLVFAISSSATSVSGEALPVVTLDRRDLTTWRLTDTDRDEHGSVRAKWRDMGAAKTRFAKAGSGDPTTTLRHVYPTEAAAQAAADARAKKLKRGAKALELTMPGLTTLRAQTPIEVTGLRSDYLGRWIVSKAEHEIDFGGGGYTTRVEAARP